MPFLGFCSVKWAGVGVLPGGEGRLWVATTDSVLLSESLTNPRGDLSNHKPEVDDGGRGGVGEVGKRPRSSRVRSYIA